MTILATCASENNDGVDIDSSHGATVEDLYYDGCDDGVALKSGLDGKTRAGTEFGVPTRDVTIRRIVAKTRSACIAIGTVASTSTKDVSLDPCTLLLLSLQPTELCRKLQPILLLEWLPSNC